MTRVMAKAISTSSLALRLRQARRMVPIEERLLPGGVCVCVLELLPSRPALGMGAESKAASYVCLCVESESVDQPWIDISGRISLVVGPDDACRRCGTSMRDRAQATRRALPGLGSRG